MSFTFSYAMKIVIAWVIGLSLMVVAFLFGLVFEKMFEKFETIENDTTED